MEVVLFCTLPEGYLIHPHTLLLKTGGKRPAVAVAVKHLDSNGTSPTNNTPRGFMGTVFKRQATDALEVIVFNLIFEAIGGKQIIVLRISWSRKPMKTEKIHHVSPCHFGKVWSSIRSKKRCIPKRWEPKVLRMRGRHILVQPLILGVWVLYHRSNWCNGVQGPEPLEKQRSHATKLNETDLCWSAEKRIAIHSHPTLEPFWTNGLVYLKFKQKPSGAC